MLSRLYNFIKNLFSIHVEMDGLESFDVRNKPGTSTMENKEE